jgi:hypothetical protein
MIHLALLYTRQCRPISVAAILDVFESVNNYYIRKQQQPAFSIQLVSNEPEMLVIYHPQTHQCR